MHVVVLKGGKELKPIGQFVHEEDALLSVKVPAAQVWQGWPRPLYLPAAQTRQEVPARAVLDDLPVCVACVSVLVRMGNAVTRMIDTSACAFLSTPNS